MSRSLLLILLFLFPVSSMAQSDVDAMLRQLDMAIDSSQYYVAMRQTRIARLQYQLKHASHWREQYQSLYALYDEYRAYKNDSAMVYLDSCVVVASQNGDYTKANDCIARLAYQCSQTGMYAEAKDLIGRVDTTSLDSTGRRDYLVAKHHLYSELAFYETIPFLRNVYNTEADALMNKIFCQLDHNDEQYLLWKEMYHYRKGDTNMALKINNQWLKLIQPGSQSYAIAAFYRFLAYMQTSDVDSMKYWLIQSAITDVRNAVMDQGSLWELANMIKDTPKNLDRSYKYIHFAWTAAQTFNTKVRSTQISPVLSLIETNYRDSLDKANVQLSVIVVAMALLFIIAMGLLVYANRQRHKLSEAQVELRKSNIELTALNKQLGSLNQQLAETNTSLAESNKMKEIYLGRFLSLCPSYIEKTEALKRNITKRLQTRDYSGLARLAAKKTDDWDEFYRNFDSAFLKLFPNFIADFNALLRPECQVKLSPDSSLTISTRIFALIRLGIKDSSRIAEFLNYSVNTIYNYRAKTKNGAIGSREEFENEVNKIGMKL